MSPDLNSLPPSRSSSSSSSLPYRNPSAASPGNPVPAPVNPVNPGTTSPRPSRGSSMGRLSVSERRRSAAGMHLNLNEAVAAAASGNNGDAPWSEHRSSMGHAFRTASPTSHGGSPVFATADPHHQRAPSLGELHQELEQEQEAQVNRLLQMIRSQQTQLQQYQQQNQQQNSSASGTAVIDDTTPGSERSTTFFPPMPLPATGPSNRLSISSSLSNRRSSRPSSQATSPNLRPQDASRGSEGMDAFPGLRESTSRRGSRDEGAYYQAEAAMLSRENQMLRQRVRELGKLAPVHASSRNKPRGVPHPDAEPLILRTALRTISSNPPPERQIGDLTTSTRPAAESGPVSGQEGPETADPQAVRSADGKD
ncbi:uncharacterized protein N7482_001708 [Penicillium canariense]|uniref:Uncharacterized protein n=1 Tax=Penicillium canariense TaxID=189055 RepID=A0A9W9IHN6_9EURO|nr:uncharacterized protein N7482_001708 [Penicillium canariense]KAJ5175831.1 hypothetical protein N7482_001708 [Penicillium canariense]